MCWKTSKAVWSSLCIGRVLFVFLTITKTKQHHKTRRDTDLQRLIRFIVSDSFNDSYIFLWNSMIAWTVTKPCWPSDIKTICFKHTASCSFHLWIMFWTWPHYIRMVPTQTRQCSLWHWRTILLLWPRRISSWGEQSFSLGLNSVTLTFPDAFNVIIMKIIKKIK